MVMSLPIKLYIIIDLIGASVASTPLEADGNFSIYLYSYLFIYIFIYIILFIYIFIYMVSRASWIPGSFEKAWLLGCNEEGVAQCCMCMRCRPLPDTYFVQ